MSAMDGTSLTCDQLDELLPDYLEGTLGARDAAAVESHAAGCGRCTALLADLNGIRAAARALPDLAPSRDLWDGVAARIAAPVIPLDSGGAGQAAGRRLRPWAWSPAWLGAAAAALVAVTAGVTYELTLRSSRGGTPVVAAAPPTTVQTAPAVSGPGAAPAGVPGFPGVPQAGTGSTQVAAGPSVVPSAKAAAGSSRGGVRAVARRAGTEVEATYDREVDALNRVLQERRATLSPVTVDVLQRNLGIIDRAIRESRAALAKDPASEFLNRQLNNALEKKLQLLRTAALLPTT